MGQTGHPYSSQVKASHQRRLGKLGAKPGKGHGYSSVYSKSKGYPSSAGTSRPMTISGGSSQKRADRYATGGSVKGKKGKNHTTNIIIAQPGGGGGPRPVPVPVGVRPGMVPPVRGPGVAPAVAPVGPAPALSPAPAVPIGPPAVASPPALPVGGRPPGFKKGGSIGMVEKAPSKTYRGFPHSPTTEVDEAVSGMKKGGAVKKRQVGGPLTPGGQRVMRRAVPPIGRPAMGRNTPLQPPPGTGGGMMMMKKGGVKKRAKGGAVNDEDAEEKREPAAFEKKEEKAGYRTGGLVGAGSGEGRLKESRVAAKLPAKTEE